jgi:AbrB family looped-hinge helix DNA binding protein
MLRFRKVHKLTSKRQVTIPANVCQALDLSPGDYVEIFERDGIGHIVRMSDQSLAGSLAHLKTDATLEDSRKAAKQRIAEKFK